MKNEAVLFKAEDTTESKVNSVEVEKILVEVVEVVGLAEVWLEDV